MIANVLQGDAFLVEEINCPLHILEGMDPHFPTCVWYFLNLTIRRRVLTKLKLRTGPLPKTTSNKDYRRFFDFNHESKLWGPFLTKMGEIKQISQMDFSTRLREESAAKPIRLTRCSPDRTWSNRIRFLPSCKSR